jgi:hypothetical protein
MLLDAAQSESALHGTVHTPVFGVEKTVALQLDALPRTNAVFRYI